MFSIDTFHYINSEKYLHETKKAPSKKMPFINRHYKTELFIVIRLLDTKVEGNVCITFCFIKYVYHLYFNPLHLKINIICIITYEKKRHSIECLFNHFTFNISLYIHCNICIHIFY